MEFSSGFGKSGLVISETQNVVNMDCKNDDDIMKSSNVDSSVQYKLGISHCKQFLMQELVPISSCLFKAIETLKLSCNMICSIIKPFRLPHVYYFIEIAVEKCSHDVILASEPAMYDGKIKQCSSGFELYHGCRYVIEINADYL